MFSVFDKKTSQWTDIHYKRSDDVDPGYYHYVVLLGKRRIGQLFHHTDWTALCEGSHLYGLRMVRGFATRRMATEYILYNTGVWLPNEIESRRISGKVMHDLHSMLLSFS